MNNGASAPEGMSTLPERVMMRSLSDSAIKPARLIVPLGKRTKVAVIN